MNQNTIIGIVVALVVLGGGYLLLAGNGSRAGGEATTTPATSTTGNAARGGASNPNLVPAAKAPDVVTDTSVAPTNSTAVVTGNVTPSGAQTSYWYEYGESTTLGQKTSAQSIGSGRTAIPSPGYITGLRANTLYYFRLSARNAYGTANGTIRSFSTNNNPPTQGLAPVATTNAAGDISRFSATLNAQVNPRSSQTTYWFEYGESSDFGSVTAFQPVGDGNASLSVSAPISGLNPKTKYFFRVNAQNQYGTVNGATKTFTTAGPASPGLPSADTTSATGVATSTATLNGIVRPNGAETIYWFEYGKDSLLGTLIGTVTPSETVSASVSRLSVSGNVSDLARNTRYFYRLVVRNQFGTTRGDIVSFRTTR